MAKRVLIVGGVAGGASCAARLRRLDETAEIVLFDRGPHVSFANCGLPYFVGNVIAEERKLLVATSELFRERFDIDVRTRHEVTAIDRRARTIRVRDLAQRPRARGALRRAGARRPGAAPIRPADARHRPAGHLRRAHHPRQRPHPRLDRRSASRARALVVGGGFIGLEMAENLAHRGLAVTVLEKLPQVMPPLDPEMAEPVREHLRAQGVTLHLGDGLARFEPRRRAHRGGHRSRARASRRSRHPRHRRAAGDRPRRGRRTAARPARRHRRRRADADGRSAHLGGRRCGRGARRRHRPGGRSCRSPAPPTARAASPPSRSAGGARAFRGVQATAVVGVFGLTVASTGASEKGLRRAGVDRLRAASTCIPATTPATIPARSPIHLKLLFSVAGRPRARRAGGRPRGRRQAHRRDRDDDPDGRHGARPRGGRAVLRAAVRRRQGSRSTWPA